VHLARVRFAARICRVSSRLSPAGCMLLRSWSLNSEAQRLQGLLSEAVAAPAPPAAAPVAPPEPTAAAAGGLSPTRRGTSGAAPAEAWELALETWIDLKASGYAIEEGRVQSLLPSIAASVPRLSRDCTHQLFEPSAQSGQPVFMKLLRAHRGQVNFLYFWKAFGEAMHMTGAKHDAGLTAELEMLRDRLLRRVEDTGGGMDDDRSAQARPERRVLPAWSLVEEVHRAASMSSAPNFWKRCSEVLVGNLGLEEISLEELTSIVLSWLHESQLWESEHGAEAQALTRRSLSMASQDEGLLPVYVHIYDVSKEESIQSLNSILAHKNSPVKFGGVFHAGVEVNGLEWSYGYSPSLSKPGVSCGKPRIHPQHVYRQTITLRNTKVVAEMIAEIISQLIEEYPGSDYNLLRRNCCHFADDFCRRLGVGGIPGWVHRLARLGAGVEAMIQSAPRPIRERFYG